MPGRNGEVADPPREEGFINRSRVELLKEMKGLEVQLLEIKEQLRVARR